MSTHEKLLRIFQEHPGEYLSGEMLAGRLAISRTAVWKGIQTLRAQGHEISAGTNRGYAYFAPGGTICKERILALLGPAAAVSLTIEPCVSSTNTLLKEQAAGGAPEGTVLIAEEQTAGRGRLGRSFHSPKGSGIYMSILLRPTLQVSEALSLTTSIAVAATETLRALTGREVGIKWVNDLYLENRKICGILTEASMDFESQRLEYAIVGIGINLEAPPEGFPEDIAQIAGALFAHGACPEGFREQLIAGILQRFLAMYHKLPTAEYLQQYRDYSCIIGRTVHVIENVLNTAEHYEALVTGIDDACGLVVQLPDGSRKTLTSGEVSLRLLS